MAVRIGHARIDERGKASGGALGDNNGKEVMISDWYNKPWTAVFRAKDASVAEKIAKTMEAACANNNIGYDQSNRTSLYQLAKANGWNVAAVGLCETDCSALVSVCVNAAGITVSKDMYTGNEKTVLNATGKFTCYTSSDYCKASGKLQRGDILLGNGHTAIVVQGAVASSSNAGSNTKVTSNKVATDAASKKDASLAGTYKTTAGLNIRNGAGTGKSIMVTLPKGTTCKCYGYYSVNAGTKWLYVVATVGGVQYTGFCSSKYLQK